MEQMTLFDDHRQTTPLASRIRPHTLEEFAGGASSRPRENAPPVN